jgi:pimeloyl-ACP methyl ester carboxylesterase
METLEPVRLLEVDHFVEGLFVKETAPSEPTRLHTPILMVHGVSHGWWAFSKWLTYLPNYGWRSYAMSLRNHPGSYGVSEERYLQLGFQDYVDDVLAVLAWLDKPAILIGHSMGGIICQKVAEQKALRALVLVASVGPGQLGPIRDPLPIDKPVMFSSDQAREQWFHRIDDASFENIYRQLVPESPSVINEYSAGHVCVDPAKILCPILVIGAQYDRTLVHDFRAIAAFHGGDYLFVPDAGHDLFLEPEAMNAAIGINRWLFAVLENEGLRFARPNT